MRSFFFLFEYFSSFSKLLRLLALIFIITYSVLLYSLTFFVLELTGKVSIHICSVFSKYYFDFWKNTSNYKELSAQVFSWIQWNFKSTFFLHLKKKLILLLQKNIHLKQKIEYVYILSTRLQYNIKSNKSIWETWLFNGLFITCCFQNDNTNNKEDKKNERKTRRALALKWFSWAFS